VILNVTVSQCRSANTVLSHVISVLSFSENTSCSILDQLEGLKRRIRAA